MAFHISVLWYEMLRFFAGLTMTVFYFLLQYSPAMLHVLPKIRDRIFPFRARGKKPILISIPHSSFFVPKEIREKMLLSDFEIRKIADLFTDELFDIPGCYIVKGKISRLVADVNRAPDDIESQARLGDERVVVDVTEDLQQVYSTPPTLEMIV